MNTTWTPLRLSKSLKLHRWSPCTHFSRSPGSSHGVCVRWDTQDRRATSWCFMSLMPTYADSMHSEISEHSELHHNSKCGGWAHHIIKPSVCGGKSWMCQSIDSRIPHKCNAKSSSIHLALTLDPGPLSTGRYNCDRVPHNGIFAQSLTLLLLASCQHAAGIRFAGVLCWEFKRPAQRQGQPEIEGNLESIIANTRSNTSNTWRLSGWLLVENFNCGCKSK